MSYSRTACQATQLLVLHHARTPGRSSPFYITAESADIAGARAKNVASRMNVTYIFYRTKTQKQENGEPAIPTLQYASQYIFHRTKTPTTQKAGHR
jgi:hypothetical protein